MSPHDLSSFESFVEMTVGDQISLVRFERFCPCCLRPVHGFKLCCSQSKCGSTDCSAKHHTKLHGAPLLIPKSNANKHISSGLSVASSASAQSSLWFAFLCSFIGSSRQGIGKRKVCQYKSTPQQCKPVNFNTRRSSKRTRSPKLDAGCQIRNIQRFDPTIVTRKVRFPVSARSSEFSVSVNEVYTVANLNISVGEADQDVLVVLGSHYLLGINNFGPR